MTQHKRIRAYRDKVISLKVSKEMYEDLEKVADDVGLPVSTVCYLATKRFLAERVGTRYQDNTLDLL